MNKKLHILFLCSWYPSKVLPTNGDFIQRHAESVNLLHKVSVVHIISDKTITKTKIENKEINNIQTLIGYIKHTKNPILKSFRFFNVYKALIKRTDSFDLIHLNVLFPFGILALYQKLIKKTPYIITEHWTDYKFPLSKKIGYFQKVISKMITKKADFVCPVSNDLKQSMINFGLQGNYFPVPNVVDTNAFNCNKNLKKNTFKIIHASNMLDKQKNISGILNVIYKLQSNISDFEFFLIGENSIKYANKAKEIGILKENIRYFNHLSHPELIEHFTDANLFILFSNYENLPCVILESFATGTPVISTNVGGIKEYFPANFGKIIPINNEVKLFEEIISYHNNKYDTATLKQMHNYVIDNFSKEKICNTFTELYNKSLI